ncbi:MAG: hypothetical protein JO251_18455 [Verrucomicrobia bacterium]|nr:hypothetical protein [Verrucomicrobiota bacterium]
MARHTTTSVIASAIMEGAAPPAPGRGQGKMNRSDGFRPRAKEGVTLQGNVANIQWSSGVDLPSPSPSLLRRVSALSRLPPMSGGLVNKVVDTAVGPDIAQVCQRLYGCGRNAG